MDLIFSLQSRNGKLLISRRHDSSIGFGAPVRANMRTGNLTNAAVTSSLLESVSSNKNFPTSNFSVFWPSSSNGICHATTL